MGRFINASFIFVMGEGVARGTEMIAAVKLLVKVRLETERCSL